MMLFLIILNYSLIVLPTIVFSIIILKKHYKKKMLIAVEFGFIHGFILNCIFALGERKTIYGMEGALNVFLACIFVGILGVMIYLILGNIIHILQKILNHSKK